MDVKTEKSSIEIAIPTLEHSGEFSREHYAPAPTPQEQGGGAAQRAVIEAMPVPLANTPAEQNFEKTESVREIEGVLEENLADLYWKLTPEEQQEFRLAGERLALQVKDHLSQPGDRSDDLFRVIHDWLKKLPNAGMFGEQEAKNKTWRLLRMKG